MGEASKKPNISPAAAPVLGRGLPLPLRQPPWRSPGIFMCLHSLAAGQSFFIFFSFKETPTEGKRETPTVSFG